MKTAFIIHGSFGNPDENWLPWLKIELEKLAIKFLYQNFQHQKIKI